MQVIQARDVTRRFSGIPVLEGLSLDVSSGDIYGLYGMPEAGKTVLIKMMLDIISRDGGILKIFSMDPSIHRREVLLRTGYTPQDPRYPNWFTLQHIIKLKRKTYNRENMEVFLRYLRDFGLWKHRDRRIMRLNIMYRKTLVFLSTLTHDPELIILDEVSDIPRDIVDEVIREFRGRKTFFISSHDLDKLGLYVERIGFINEGRIAYEGTVNQLKKMLSDTVVLIKISEARRDIWQKINRLEGVEELSIKDRILRIRVTSDMGVINNIRQILKGHKIEINWIKWIGKREDDDK